MGPWRKMDAFRKLVLTRAHWELGQWTAVERNANRGGGSITTGAAANNCVIVGTSRGTCIFYDFADGTSVEVDCAVSLSSSSSSAGGAGAAGGRGGAGGLGLGLAHKWQQQQHHHQQHSSSSSPPPDVAIGRVWLDPTARHAIATLHDGLNRPVAAVYFRPAVDAKARPLRVPLSSSTSSSSSSSSSAAAAAAAKEKESGDGRSMDVTAVGWHAARCTDVAADVLVGTADGALYELSLDASTGDASSGSKKSSSSSSSVVRVFRKLLELTEVREPVAGLYVDCVERQYTVLAATATRLYCFTGGDTLEATLTGPGGRGPRGGGAEALVEMPVEAGRHHVLHSRHHNSVTSAVAR